MKTKIILASGTLLLALVVVALLLRIEPSLPESGPGEQAGASRHETDSSSFKRLSARVPDSVLPILGRNGEDHQERRQAVARLERAMSEAEQQGLRAFLLSPSTPLTSGRSIMAEAAIRNNALNKLKDASPEAFELTDLLISIYQDREHQHVVMRDYALQHIASWHRKLGKQRDASEQYIPSQQRAIEETLWSALDETDSSLAGTALLSLRRIGVAKASVNQTRLKGAALELARDPTASPLTRTTALQLSGHWQLEAIIPVATQIATGNHSIAVRRAAIAALGALGTEAAQKTLEQLRSTVESNLKSAVQHASNL